MIKIMPNPFSSYGKPVYGEQFIGRSANLMTIQDRIINSPDPGCLSIVGSPRIGKSSLVHHALIYPQASLFKQGLITFKIDLPALRNKPPYWLFIELVKQTIKIYRKYGQPDDLILELEASVLEQRDNPNSTLLEKIHDFFAEVKSKQWRVVSILEEFDEARNLYKNDLSGIFYDLRNLAYEPEWSICLVTVSRRSLSDITNQSGGDISTFPGIFEHETLRCFNEVELRQLITRLKDTNISINEDLFLFFEKYTGGHPHLASALGFEVAKNRLHNQKCANSKMKRISLEA
jgi:hypothetical protein